MRRLKSTNNKASLGHTHGHLPNLGILAMNPRTYRYSSALIMRSPKSTNNKASQGHTHGQLQSRGILAMKPEDYEKQCDK